MARKRMIDPQIWESEDFGKLSNLGKLIWIGLISNADDDGRGRAKCSYIRSMLFPYDEGENSIKKIEAALDEVAKHMGVTFYMVDDNEYYQLKNWDRFQSIEKRRPSILPPMADNSTITRGVVGEQSGNKPRQVAPNRIEKNINEKKESEVDAETASTRAPKHKYGQFNNVLLTEIEYQKILAKQDGDAAIDFLSEYRERRGYKCKSDYLSILNWVFDAVRERKQRKAQIQKFGGEQNYDAE